MSFAHCIAIRYNVPQLFTGRTDRGGRRTADDEWLRHRQGLFTTFTLPSLANQSCRDFKVVVFFDQGSPSWLKDENVTLEVRYGNYLPVYVESMTDAVAKLDRLILDARDELGITHSIVTRLDNDDALHRDAVKVLQSRFRGQAFEVFNYSGILSLKRAPGEVLNYSNYRGGPFVSLVERIEDGFHTRIFEKNHGHWFREGRVTQLGPFPYAMQVLHDRNLSNAPSGMPIFGIDLRKYGLDYTMSESYGTRFLTHVRYKLDKKAASQAKSRVASK